MSRAGWSFFDQAVSSATNFTVTLVAIRTLDVEAFGAFALAFALYVPATAIGRGLVAQPFAVLQAEGDDDEAARSALGASLLVGAATTLMALLIAAAFGGSTARTILVLAAFLPFLLLQDNVRLALITNKRPHVAALNDGIWAVLMVAGLAGAFVAFGSSAEIALGIWAVSGSIAAGIGVVLFGSKPSLRYGARWLRSTAHLGVRFTGEALLGQGSFWVALGAVSVVAGVGAAGTVAGTRTLFGPVNVAALGMFAFGVPEATRLLVKNRVRFTVFVRWATGILFLAGPLVGVLLVVTNLGELLTGDAWARLEPLVLPTSLALAGRGAIVGVTIGLRAFKAATLSLRAAAVSAVLSPVGAGVGGVLGGTVGAAYGLAVASAISLGVYVLAVRLASHADDPSTSV